MEEFSLIFGGALAPCRNEDPAWALDLLLECLKVEILEQLSVQVVAVTLTSPLISANWPFGGVFPDFLGAEGVTPGQG